MEKTVLSILYFVVLILSGYGLGELILHKININRSHWLNFLINSTLGLGFLSLIHFLFGCIKGFNKPLIYVLIGIICLSALYGIYNIYNRIKIYFTSPREKIKRPYNKLALLMLTLMIVGLTLTFVNALAPSISDDWDSLAYHLSAPKLYLQNGGFYYINFSSHTNFPMLQEVLYITPIFFKIPVAGKLLHFFFSIMSMLLVGYCVSNHFNINKDRFSVVWGAFLVFSMPMVLWLSTTAYIDITVSFFGLLGLYFALEYSNNKNTKDLILCAIACGFGASCKMLGLQYVLIFSIWILLSGLFNKKFEIKHILIFIGISLLVCLPWYIRSTVWTGNPFYPFFYSIIGGNDWTQSLADFYTSNQNKFGVGHNFRSFMTTPLQMTLFPNYFYDTPGLYVGGVLVLTFPVMCLLYQVRKRKLLLLAISICIEYIIWFALTHQSRYLIPMFLLSCVFIPAVLSYIKGVKFVKYSLVLIFIVISLIGLLQMYNTALVRYNVVCGSISQEEYLSMYFKPYEAHQYINSLDEKNLKVGLFGDTEGFYLNKPYVWCDEGHNNLFKDKYNSADELIRDLKKQNIKYLIVPFGKNPPTIGEKEHASNRIQYLYEAIESGKILAVFPTNISESKVFVFEIE